MGPKISINWHMFDGSLVNHACGIIFEVVMGETQPYFSSGLDTYGFSDPCPGCHEQLSNNPNDWILPEREEVDYGSEFETHV